MVQIKIYPSKHKIELINESKFDVDLNIPLAYINLDYTKYEINKLIELDFLQSESNKNIIMNPILPMQQITDINKITFNKFEEQVVPENLFKKQGNTHFFTPPYEFVPYEFSYSATIRKNMAYKTSGKYNINVACIDDADSLDLSTRLSEIFTVPASRQLVPPNISINNNRAEISALTDMTYNEADFVFMETFDGQYLDVDKTQEANISSFLDDNINVWIGCDEHYYYKYKNDDLGYLTFTSVGAFKEFELKRSLLTTNRYIYSDVYFNLDRAEYRQQDGKNIYNMFTSNLSPILIVEHIGKGFEVISHNCVLQEPMKYKDLIYEVMMYIYLMSYKRSGKVDEWITYTIPDFEVINNTLYTKSNFISHTTLSEMFNLTSSDYSVYQVDIYDNSSDNVPVNKEDLSSYPDIDCIDIINNRLVFKINGENYQTLYSEIDKPTGWISIYKDGKIYYLDQLYYYIESNIENKLFASEQNYDLIIKLYPFKSSKYNINIKTDLQVTIKNIKTDVNGVLRAVNEVYTLYLELIDNKHVLQYSLKDEFDTDDNNLIKLCDIEIKQAVDNTYITDMRQLGGGLTKEAKDDYDLLDIGHVNGRPYRKSNTLIVKMPTKYEPYKDQILEAINKYRVGEDYPIIFFEDEDE